MQDFDFATYRREWRETFAELTKCRDQRHLTFDRFLDTRYPHDGSKADLAASNTLELELARLEERIAELDARLSALLDSASSAAAVPRYQRPGGGRLLTLVNRPLGPPAAIETGSSQMRV